MIVSHSRGSYAVHFQDLGNSREWFQDAYVITDENVAAHWGQLLPEAAPRLILPPGENTKSLHSLQRSCSWLAGAGASRKSRILAFGGGVIGDLVGFVAATYMRGVEYVQIPTSLLAQVDSSVGGKVAVDLPEGKNLVGAFYPPSHVIVDTAVLQTLPMNQFRSGMAEVCKYGFIMDVALAKSLSHQALESGDPGIEEVVHRCIELKRDVVQNDEFETKGRRAILNFGHTVGHAIEQVTGYREYLHGEAVAIGMVAEARLGERIGFTATGTSEFVEHALSVQGLGISLRTPLDTSQLLNVMRRDKKAKRNELTFSLLTEIGGCKLVEDVGEQEVLAALQTI